MDRDGDVDVLSASRDANAIAVHWQLRAHQALVGQAQTLTIDGELLRAEDADDAPSELVYTLASGPSAGVLVLDGAPLGQGATFTQADVDAGRVAYLDDGVDLAPDAFAFTLADGGEGGFQPALGTFTIGIAGADALVVLPFDEGSGTLATDASGMGNDGVLVNGPIYEPDTADASPFALRFDGVDDRVELGALDVRGSGLTLAARFKADAFPGPSRDPRIVSKAAGPAADEHVFLLGTIEAGAFVRLRARVRVAGTTTTLVAGAGNLSPGAWRHAALTYDGAFLRLYLDGAEVGSVPLSGAVDVDPAMLVAVGNQPTGAGERAFDGLLDDVRIVQRALDADEIAALARGE
jgi:hypothetical protein